MAENVQPRAEIEDDLQRFEMDIRRIDEAFDHDDLLREGRLSLIDEIEVDTFQVFRQQLLWCLARGLRRIQVEINSPGGNMFSGFALFDLIRRASKQFGAEVVTEGTGCIASMASVVFQAGTRRVVTSNAMYMLHEVRTLRWGDDRISKVADDFTLLRRLQEKAVAIYCERSSLTAEVIEEHWQRKDWWVDAEEMLELGLCDEVVDTRLNTEKIVPSPLHRGFDHDYPVQKHLCSG
jgi:ATP-dependent Clp protease protease subunit